MMSYRTRRLHHTHTYMHGFEEQARAYVCMSNYRNQWKQRSLYTPELIRPIAPFLVKHILKLSLL